MKVTANILALLKKKFRICCATTEKKKNIRKFVIGMMDIDLAIQKFLIHGQ